MQIYRINIRSLIIIIGEILFIRTNQLTDAITIDY